MNIRSIHPVIYALVIIIALMFMTSKLVYNKMIDEEHFLHISHGRLEVELQKKEALNSRALQAVQVYVEMEGELMHKLITLAREVKAGANASRIIAMRGEIERLLSSIDLLVMSSPALKSKSPYIHLMDTFRATENSVLAARLQYNVAACEYNLFLEKVPYRYVAWFYDFKKAHIFNAGDAAKTLPFIPLYGVDVDRQGV